MKTDTKVLKLVKRPSSAERPAEAARTAEAEPSKAPADQSQEMPQSITPRPKPRPAPVARRQSNCRRNRKPNANFGRDVSHDVSVTANGRQRDPAKRVRTKSSSKSSGAGHEAVLVAARRSFEAQL